MVNIHGECRGAGFGVVLNVAQDQFLVGERLDNAYCRSADSNNFFHLFVGAEAGPHNGPGGLHALGKFYAAAFPEFVVMGHAAGHDGGGQLMAKELGFGGGNTPANMTPANSKSIDITSGQFIRASNHAYSSSMINSPVSVLREKRFKNFQPSSPMESCGQWGVF